MTTIRLNVILIQIVSKMGPWSFAWLAVVCRLIARQPRQRNALPGLSPQAPGEGQGLPDLCFIVPARDESANIGRCVRSLLAQRYPRARLRVVVVDDASGDNAARSPLFARAGKNETPPGRGGVIGSSAKAAVRLAQWVVVLPSPAGCAGCT